MVKNKKIAYVTLRYGGRLYVVEEECDFDTEDEGIFFMWEEGNWSCDCNRSLFIQQQVDDKFPKLPCSSEVIDLMKITIKGKKQVTRKYRE